MCVDFGRMDKVVAVHEEDMDVVVQPGVEWQDLNRVLEGKGLFFPPDPGPGARIGYVFLIIFLLAMRVYASKFPWPRLCMDWETQFPEFCFQ